MTAPAPNRRTFALFVLGTVAFTVYGSLVPFEFHARTWADVSDAFVWAMSNRLWFESRSDALANLMLGVPLGFGLMGLIFVDRHANRGRQIAIGLILLPGCLAFAAAVEFLQLFFPLRTCAGSDVLCQGIGATIGIVAWIARGPWFVEQARTLWSGSDSSKRLLAAYVALLIVIQTLPLDLSASPKDAYKKLRDEARWVPFGEFRVGDGWEHAAKLARTFGLFLPVGLLLTGRRLSAAQMFVWAAVIPLALEAAQTFVRSRVPSASDAVGGSLGILAGALISGKARPWQRAGALMVGWLGLLLIIWGPFPFVERHPPGAFDWMPGLPLESGNPLFALEEILVKLVLFGLGGVLIGTVTEIGEPRIRIGAATILCVGISSAIEVMQTSFGSHSPSITDVILGGLGGFLGAVIVCRGVRTE